MTVREAQRTLQSRRRADASWLFARNVTHRLVLRPYCSARLLAETRVTSRKTPPCSRCPSGFSKRLPDSPRRPKRGMGGQMERPQCYRCRHTERLPRSPLLSSGRPLPPPPHSPTPPHTPSLPGGRPPPRRVPRRSVPHSSNRLRAPPLHNSAEPPKAKLSTARNEAPKPFRQAPHTAKAPLSSCQRGRPPFRPKSRARIPSSPHALPPHASMASGLLRCHTLCRVHRTIVYRPTPCASGRAAATSLWSFRPRGSWSPKCAPPAPTPFPPGQIPGTGPPAACDGSATCSHDAGWR
jgi:hypothetical protein